MKLSETNQDLTLLTGLALVIGIAVALLMWAFEGLILLMHQPLFEVQLWQLSLPFVAVTIYYIVIKLVNAKSNSIGVSHVVEQIAYSRSRFPIKNLILQFIGAPLALIGQFSAGKEGPVVHLGAALASLSSDRFQLNHSSREILTACGAAAAISAVFATPLAAVIFAIEVVYRRLQTDLILPLMAASVTSYWIGKWLNIEFFNFDNIGLYSIVGFDYVWLGALAFAIGIASAVFNYLILKTRQDFRAPLLLRLFFAAGLTSLLLYFYPQVAGSGYHLINEILQNPSDAILLIIFQLFMAKLAATIVMVAFNVPGGLIAPILVIGSLIGATIGLLTGQNELLPLFVMVGATAMMGAVINAPLAALAAVLELSSSIDIVWPAMFSIILANLICHQYFKQPGIFIALSGIGEHRRIYLADLPINRIITLLTWQQKEQNEDSICYIRINHQLAIRVTQAQLAELTSEQELLAYAFDYPVFLIQRNTALILETAQTLEIKNLSGVLVHAQANQYHCYKLSDLNIARNSP